jgi:hypothetical protein
MLSREVPLDYAVIKFPGNQFKGEIAPEIYSLVDQGLIRVVDIAFISKDIDGQFTALELNDLPEDVYRQFVPFGAQLESLFTAEDLETAASYVPADCAALMLLWQNVWTEKFRRAVSNASGQILVHERVPAEVLNEIVDDVAVANG